MTILRFYVKTEKSFQSYSMLYYMYIKSSASFA